ncbi:MAG: hypothetical protein COA78_10435 [Blastopirellula sp.]|nr:MAG: hypothetical protein COA78_10435 [Blastopirellula sp.]
MTDLYVTDTVGLINYFHETFSRSSSISASTRRIYDKAFSTSEGSVRLSIPSVVFVEIHEKWCRTEEFSRKFYYNVFKRVCDSPNIEVKPIDREVLENLLRIRGSLEDHDLHDKLILASAMMLDCPLITCDSEIIKFNDEFNVVDIIF